MCKTDEKTEVLVTSTNCFTDRVHESQVRFGDAGSQASESARNLGVIFDNDLEMSNHIKTVCRASFTQLRYLRSINDTLTHKSFANITHTFICSCLDYCMVCLSQLFQNCNIYRMRLPGC